MLQLLPHLLGVQQHSRRSFYSQESFRQHALHVSRLPICLTPYYLEVAGTLLEKVDEAVLVVETQSHFDPGLLLVVYWMSPLKTCGPARIMVFVLYVKDRSRRYSLQARQKFRLGPSNEGATLVFSGARMRPLRSCEVLLPAHLTSTFQISGEVEGKVGGALCFSAITDTAASTLFSKSSSEIVSDVLSRFSMNWIAAICTLSVNVECRLKMRHPREKIGSNPLHHQVYLDSGNEEYTEHSIQDDLDWRVEQRR